MAESGFLIAGTVYEVPAIDSFTMDENKTFWDYTGFVQEDFGWTETAEEQEALSERLRHPFFWTAMGHIAYQREHPEVSEVEVRAVLGRTNRLAMLSALSEVEDDSPLESTNEPEPSSLSVKVGLSEPSGSDSTNDSDVRVAGLHRIGTGR